MQPQQPFKNTLGLQTFNARCGLFMTAAMSDYALLENLEWQAVALARQQGHVKQVAQVASCQSFITAAMSSMLCWQTFSASCCLFMTAPMNAHAWMAKLDCKLQTMHDSSNGRDASRQTFSASCRPFMTAATKGSVAAAKSFLALFLAASSSSRISGRMPFTL